jgi:hypothetical protein
MAASFNAFTGYTEVMDSAWSVQNLYICHYYDSAILSICHLTIPRARNTTDTIHALGSEAKSGLCLARPHRFPQLHYAFFGGPRGLGVVALVALDLSR